MTALLETNYVRHVVAAVNEHYPCVQCPADTYKAAVAADDLYWLWGSHSVIIGPFRARFPQLRVPQSCCGAGK
jgi:hypothetical protein